MAFSENSLIQSLSPFIKKGKDGVGDDCATLPGLGNDSVMVLSTDLLIENTHFLVNDRLDWYSLGIKAAAANVSDISAMGAKPRYLLISLGIPSDVSPDRITRLYSGMQDFIKPLGAEIIGGDTVKSEQVCINVSIIGEKKAAAASCLRSDLKPGDYLYVTGDLGKARTGLHFLLTKNQEHGHKFSPDFINQAIQSHFHPIPRNEFARFLSETFSRVGMIDISDSLFNECLLLSEASQVGLDIQFHQIPVNPLTNEYCNKLNICAERFALFSGEEYELLFGIDCPPEKLLYAMRKQSLSAPVTCIGRIMEGSGVRYYNRNAQLLNITNETFQHF